MEVKEARIEHARSYVEHSERLLSSNGKNGLIFSPRESGSYRITDSDIDAVKKRWSKSASELGFERAWLLWEKDLVVGHTVLRGGQLNSNSHRLSLQIGIEENFRNKGLGKIMTRQAIEWARTLESVTWIDLAVFGENLSAIKLYNSFGFGEVGRIDDAYRVNNMPIANVYMALKMK